MAEGEDSPDLSRRASGVLLHPTSLPSGAIGDLAASRHFVDWLARAGQRYWQILPLVPVDGGGSPYNGLSAFAGNPLLVSPSFLDGLGLLSGGDPSPPHPATPARVDYPSTLAWKNDLLARAFERFEKGAAAGLEERFDDYREANRGWLFDYALFRALREHHHEAAWTTWPADIRGRDPEAVAGWAVTLGRHVDRYAFQQFLFDLEWRELRRYAAARGVAIIGDLPIFVAHDSADVWANPEIFLLDEGGIPAVVSGVPPDYFSATGQRWGNPLYRWDLLSERSYDWWVARFRRTFEMVDVVRVDHFRGFESYWEVPAEEETAEKGRWIAGPGAHFFREVERQLGRVPIIVEDLGMITRAVEDLRDELGFPGMRVLQFAFDDDPRNPHLPGNYPPLSVAYTGTHDNDTLRGWLDGLSAEERRRVRSSLGEPTLTTWALIERLFQSRANLVIVPLQDLLELGSEARMNTPGIGQESWTWRATTPPDEALAARLREVTVRAGRA